jgi:phage gp36-like protein
MAGPTVYCTLADVLALVSLDAQARLATDPQNPVPLAVKGDGHITTFDTPFMGSTTISCVVGGVTTAATLIPGGAANGCDQVHFASAPASLALITAKADIAAVNTFIIGLCMTLGANKIKGSLARYLPPDDSAPPLAVMAVLQPLNVFFTRWFLRMRRSMSEYDPIIEEYKQNCAWLTNVATGKIALPSSAPIQTAAAPLNPPAVRAEPSVFEAPYSSSDFLGPF